MATVVTSDKDIIFYVNRFKAKTITSEKFADYVTRTLDEYYTEITPDKDENPEVSEEEVSFWERLFSAEAAPRVIPVSISDS